MTAISGLATMADGPRRKPCPAAARQPAPPPARTARSGSPMFETAASFLRSRKLHCFRRSLWRRRQDLAVQASAFVGLQRRFEVRDRDQRRLVIGFEQLQLLQRAMITPMSTARPSTPPMPSHRLSRRAIGIDGAVAGAASSVSSATVE